MKRSSPKPILRLLVPLVAGSAVGMAYNLLPRVAKEASFAADLVPISLEGRVDQETTLRNFPRYTDKRYHAYDSHIAKTVTALNAHFKDIPGFKPLDPLIVKAMVIKETGSPRDREAFSHDPLQIANTGDYALDDLKLPETYSRLGLPNGSTTFLRYAHTPRRNGELDYSAEQSMRPTDSVYGGIIFLYAKAFEYKEATVETGIDLLEYKVRKGDRLSSVARVRHTTVDTMVKYTPGLNPDKIWPGQKIHFKEAERRVVPSAFNSWEHAVERYNSKPQYAKEVFALVRSVEEKKSSN